MPQPGGVKAMAVFFTDRRRSNDGEQGGTRAGGPPQLLQEYFGESDPDERLFDEQRAERAEVHGIYSPGDYGNRGPAGPGTGPADGF